MTESAALALLVLLLVGPLAAAPLEHNIEFFFLAVGLVATALAGDASSALFCDAATTPVPITAAVFVAAVTFGVVRTQLDRLFRWLDNVVSPGMLTGLSVLIIGLLSSIVTAIVAALLLVEAVGLLRLPERERTRVVIAGCFTIGLGSSLTPLGEPLATLAARAMGLPFQGLFLLLGAYVAPGMLISAAIAGFFARRRVPRRAREAHARESLREIVLQAVKVYAFVAGLVLISDAFAPFAVKYTAKLGMAALFWVNTLSAVLDNATLVALEIHQMEPAQARQAIISLLVAGGLLIPGNIPNIICAGQLRIGSAEWARIGIPLGLAMMAAYFLALRLTN